MTGSTVRMYQRQVSSRPRSVLAISSSSEPLGPGQLEHQVVDRAAPGLARLARRPPGGTGAGRGCRLRIHDVRPSARPLSNTETSEPDAVATRNGAHSSPGSAGSLRRSKGVRHMALAEAGAARRARRRRSGRLRRRVPSRPRRAVIIEVGRGVGRQKRPRSARRAARRGVPPSPVARTSRSFEAAEIDLGEVERSPVPPMPRRSVPASRATSSSLPVGCSWRSRSPVAGAEVDRRRSGARRTRRAHARARRGAVEGARQAGEHPFEARRDRSAQAARSKAEAPAVPTQSGRHRRREVTARRRLRWP